ncbi:MAG: DUF1573 domain-containing protein [Bacteroidales bacterium]|nr:DUF1573 domain-containing protein [Bacteroidales bacterium]
MKKLFVILFTLLISSGYSFAQSESDGPQLVFDQTVTDDNGNIVYEYGEISKNSNGWSEFKFTNTGNQPLVLSRVKATCGCTVPTWPRQPILPGKSEVIKVKYNTKKAGPFNKSIIIESNASQTPVICRIKGKVVEEEVEGFPIKENSFGALNE